MNKVILVVGVPGSGKSWVCDKLTDKYEYVRNDDHIGGSNQASKYVRAILDATKASPKAVLAEAPFSISEIKEPLERNGIEVTCVFILEDQNILRGRYMERDGKEIPKGHLSRQVTYAKRAQEYRSYYGTSEQVLTHLKALSL